MWCFSSQTVGPPDLVRVTRLLWTLGKLSNGSSHGWEIQDCYLERTETLIPTYATVSPPRLDVYSLPPLLLSVAAADIKAAEAFLTTIKWSRRRGGGETCLVICLKCLPCGCQTLLSEIKLSRCHSRDDQFIARMNNTTWSRRAPSL